MGGKRFPDGTGPALFVSLNALKESYVRVGIVAGLVHILQSEEIGLAFVVARKLQKSHGNEEVHSLIDSVASPTIGKHNHRWNRSDLDQVAFGSLLRAVAGANVGNFVGHYT